MKSSCFQFLLYIYIPSTVDNVICHLIGDIIYYLIDDISMQLSNTLNFMYFATAVGYLPL